MLTFLQSTFSGCPLLVYQCRAWNQIPKQACAKKRTGPVDKVFVKCLSWDGTNMSH